MPNFFRKRILKAPLTDICQYSGAHKKIDECDHFLSQAWFQLEDWHMWRTGISNHPCSLPAPLLWWKIFKVNLCSCAKIFTSICYWVFFWKQNYWVRNFANKFTTCSCHVCRQLYFQPDQCDLKANPSSLSPLTYSSSPGSSSWCVYVIILKTCLRPKWEIQRVALSPTPPSFSPPPAQSHPDNQKESQGPIRI